MLVSDDDVKETMRVVDGFYCYRANSAFLHAFSVSIYKQRTK